MTSMNHPSQHFAMNEAWILSDQKGEANQVVAGSRSDVRKQEEKYQNGKVKATWSGRTGANGDYVLHGPENWFYPDGKKKYEVTYQDGRKTGKESFWLAGGALKWSWDHHPDGTGTWTQYRADGSKKIESNWRGFKADGLAIHWNLKGGAIQKITFKDGAIVD
jgi:antitoxin component YwqK of YwqJK toxin-antitoxin module